MAYNNTHFYYLAPFLWIRHLGAAEPGGSGLRAFMRLQLRNWLGSQLKTRQGLEGLLPRQPSPRYWQEASVPCIDLSIGCLRKLMTRQLASSRVSTLREQGGRQILLMTYTSTHYHFCHILFIRIKSLNPSNSGEGN